MLEVKMGLIYVLVMLTWIIGLKQLKATKDIKKLRRVALLYHHGIVIISLLTILNVLSR